VEITVQAIFVIAYLGIGLFQLFAIMDGLEYLLGIPSILAAIGAFFVTWIPLLGTILGVVGAVNVWHWSLVGAILLFGFPIILGFITGGFALLFDTLSRRRQV
jgi:hypothetical protein